MAATHRPHRRNGHHAAGAAVSVMPSAADRARFASLLAEWREATLVSSASNRMKTHPAYRAMVAMGAPAVPLLLDAMLRGEWLLHSALTEITGDDRHREGSLRDLHGSTRRRDLVAKCRLGFDSFVGHGAGDTRPPRYVTVGLEKSS